MSEQFSAYARHYDLLYQDKDYGAETEYIVGLLGRFGKQVNKLLEFGVGTGRHAELLAKIGFAVDAVETSEEMRSRASRRADKLFRTSTATTFSVHQGDIRFFSLNREFDAVLSLFHVVSYQVSNEDIDKTFANVSNHLRPGGLFIFDVWYGPAVLTIGPSVKIKRAEDEISRVLRIAEPKIDVSSNVVEVHYTIYVEDKGTNSIHRLSEVHPMRYFFDFELGRALNNNGMDLIHSEEWLSSRKPGLDTWGVCFVAARRA